MGNSGGGKIARETFLFENLPEAFVGCASVGVDVVACRSTCFADGFGMGDEVVHEGSEGGGVAVLKRAATSLEVLRLLEALVVGAEKHRNAIDCRLGDVVDANAETSADKGYGAIAVDG